VSRFVGDVHLKLLQGIATRKKRQFAVARPPQGVLRSSTPCNLMRRAASIAKILNIYVRLSWFAVPAGICLRPGGSRAIGGKGQVVKLVNKRKRVQCSIERRTRLEGKAAKKQAGQKTERSHKPMVVQAAACITENTVIEWGRLTGLVVPDNLKEPRIATDRARRG
jgi:hypothetical protein